MARCKDLLVPWDLGRFGIVLLGFQVHRLGTIPNGQLIFCRLRGKTGKAARAPGDPGHSCYLSLYTRMFGASPGIKRALPP